MSRRGIGRRALRAGVALGVIAVLSVGVVVVTFVPYVRDSQGEPMSVLVATWGRDHGLGAAVAVAEDFYYAHIEVTAVGGSPTESADFGSESGALGPIPSGAATMGAIASPSPSGPQATGSATPTPSATPKLVRAHLTPPDTLVSPAGGVPLPSEGVWQPVASRVDGIPAVYATRVRPDATHTSVLASLMWIDTKLAAARYVPGYQEPGGPNPFDGALPAKLWPDVLANVNGAFRLQDSLGGYVYDGVTVQGLVDGQATLVIDRDGSVGVGSWGRDVKASPAHEVVRQNLALIVDGGVSRVRPGDGFTWGATTHGENLAWRSAIGQRKDGSIVYIGSPGLSAESMADTLVSAGVQRAMVLDMNNWWVAGFYFTHAADGSPICHRLDPAIQEGCDRFLQRYKRDSIHFLAK